MRDYCMVQVRMKSSLGQPEEQAASPPQSPSGKASLNQQRFRKKSLNMAMGEPDLDAIAERSALFQKHAANGVMSREQLVELLSTLYRPSEVPPLALL